MNEQAKPLVKYLDGSDTRFIILVYQRNYDWKSGNCRQLYDDLKKLIAQANLLVLKGQTYGK